MGLQFLNFIYHSNGSSIHHLNYKSRKENFLEFGDFIEIKRTEESNSSHHFDAIFMCQLRHYFSQEIPPSVYLGSTFDQ